MDRPLPRWLLFSLCLMIFIGAMAWVTHRALALERQYREAADETRRQERIRLALWRIETAASSVFVRESARPARHYQPFLPVDTVDTGVVKVPSPLLGGAPELVNLHFECSTAGDPRELCSPQLPVGPDRDLARERYSLEAPTAPLETKLKELRSLLETHHEWESVAGFGYPAIVGKTGTGQFQINPGSPPVWATHELRWRDDALVKKPIAEEKNATKTPSKKAAAGEAHAPAEPDAGEMRAVWLGDELVFVRPVRDPQGGPRLQGVWMDWPALQAALLDSVRDLLPMATLQPRNRNATDPEDWMSLVSLPVRLVPGEVPLSGTSPSSGLKTALLLAWICLALAAAAIALVLHRAIVLSERRAAFVSSVTHELRTPLTTFQLYSELLERGAVPGEEQRREYLSTLRRESERLTHLVENVLSFSRIERGRGIPKLETMTVADLLSRTEGRLRERCAGAGLTWIVEADGESLAATVRADAGAVEQILFNLVDNAAKYAAPLSEPKELHLRIEAGKNGVGFALRDFGPGLTKPQQRELFRPFHKSATEAAHSAPGVGLGLSLCRRLAREMGGDLRFESPPGGGAAFRLELRRNSA